jgi:hypothetical protein
MGISTTRSCATSRWTGDIDARGPAIAAQWTVHHVATATWSLTLTLPPSVVDVDEVTVSDPATERRCATVTLPMRGDLDPKIHALVDDLDRLIDPYLRSLDQLDPSFRIRCTGPRFSVSPHTRSAPREPGVYRHNLEAMASYARNAAYLADEIRMTARWRW